MSSKPAATIASQPVPVSLLPLRTPAVPHPHFRTFSGLITAYRTETKLEPVTTYQRSCYWEPVTSYKYTSYYDPCTGCCQKVATPCTSYVQRSKCNAVTSYVQRCQMVPYTAYRQSCYMEPVVTYNPCPTCPTSVPTTPTTPTPGVIEGSGQTMPGGPKPGVIEGDDRLPKQDIPGGYNRFYPTPPPSKDAPLRMDRISKFDNATAQLQGTVVRDDRITPRGGAKIFFATAEKKNAQYSAATDAVGRFSIELPPGDWTMYIGGPDGKPTYHSVLHVKPNDQRLVTVVSR
jgi:hypothetical protein